MIAAAFFLFQSGITAFLCGIGLASWIWPASFRGKGLDLPATLMLGFGVIAVVSGYFFLLGQTVFRAVPVCLLGSLLLLTCRYLQSPRDLQACLWQTFTISRQHALVFISGGLLGSALILPGIIPRLGQPFRIGIDEYGYGIISQYVFEGHTRTPLEAEVMRETGQNNLPDALANCDGALNFNVCTTAGFLLAHLRVGYPCMIAALFKFLGCPFVYPYLFLMLFWPALFFVSLVWFFFNHIVGSGPSRSLLYALAISLNCNLLNTACEGQHSQWFAAPYLGLVFVLIYVNRRAPGHPPSWRHELLLMAALAAFIIVIYSEALYALLLVAVFIFGTDLFFKHWDSLKADLKFGSAMIIGFLATGPLICLWAPVFLRQASDVAAGDAGFVQPYWANPVEIMGWIDIYDHVRIGDKLLDRAPLFLTLEVTTSILLLSVVCFYLRTITRREVIYWVSPILFVVLVFVQTYFIRNIINYAYMKSYTILSFPILTLFYVALEQWSFQFKNRAAILRQSSGWLVFVTSFCSILVGCFYLKGYQTDAEKLPTDVAELRDLGHRIDFRHIVILTPHHYLMRGSIFYASLGLFIPFNWYDFYETTSYLVPYRGMPIYILGFKSEIPADRLPDLLQKNRLIFQNQGLFIVDSGQVVEPPPWQLGAPYQFIQAGHPGCNAWQVVNAERILRDCGF